MTVLHALLAMNPLNVCALLELKGDGVSALLSALSTCRSPALLHRLQSLLLTCALLQAHLAPTVLSVTLAHARDRLDPHALDLACAMLRSRAAWSLARSSSSSSSSAMESVTSVPSGRSVGSSSNRRPFFTRALSDCIDLEVYPALVRASKVLAVLADHQAQGV